ncbi:hypothetical protein BDV3_004196 [Batrachochytrium dendrobatidis]
MAARWRQLVTASSFSLSTCRRMPACSVIQNMRFYASGLPSKNSGHQGTEPVDVIHKEEYLEVARNWPTDHYSPDNFRMRPEDKKWGITPTPPSTGFDNVNAGHDPEPATWGHPIWSRLLIVSVLSVVAYRLHEHYMKDKKPEDHPVYIFLQSLHDQYGSSKVAHDYDAHTLPIRQRWADDRLIFTSALRGASEVDTPVMVLNTDMHLNCSDRLVGVSPEISWEGVKYKTASSDKYYIPPYPKNRED